MDMDKMITSQEAAELIKPPMSIHAFRKAATKEKALREARVKVHDSLYLYDKDKVLAWAESVAKTSKRRKRRS